MGQAGGWLGNCFVTGERVLSGSIVKTADARGIPADLDLMDRRQDCWIDIKREREREREREMERERERRKQEITGDNSS